jgi:DNA-binding transcriptional LysR family regulator
MAATAPSATGAPIVAESRGTGMVTPTVAGTPMPHLPDFEAWAIFAKVAERGSFSQAAEDLGLSKTTVSKAVTRLEQRMRITLLHRTTRRLSLTENGRMALERAARILADGAAVEEEVFESAVSPRGKIKMAASVLFGLEILSPILPRFLERFADIDLDLHLTDEPIDLVGDGFDLALRVGTFADSSLRISRLISFRRPAVASPAYLDRVGRPRHPRDLADLEAIIYSHIPIGARWRFHRDGEEDCEVVVSGRYHVNNSGAATPALVAGMGVALQPEFFVWRELQDGRLEEVLPDWTTEPGPLNILTPPGQGHPARVRALITFLRDHFTTQPWAHGIEV